jgi:hypothetical protein
MATAPSVTEIRCSAGSKTERDFAGPPAPGARNLSPHRSAMPKAAVADPESIVSSRPWRECSKRRRPFRDPPRDGAARQLRTVLSAISRRLAVAARPGECTRGGATRLRRRSAPADVQVASARWISCLNILFKWHAKRRNSLARRQSLARPDASATTVECESAVVMPDLRCSSSAGAIRRDLPAGHPHLRAAGAARQPAASPVWAAAGAGPQCVRRRRSAWLLRPPTSC